MPIPAAYATETQLAEFIYLDELGGPLGVAGDLDISIAELVQTVIHRVMRDCQVTDIADETDPSKLEALASYRAWEFAVRRYVVKIKLTHDGSISEEQQKFDHAKAMFDYVREQAEQLGFLALTTRLPVVGPLLATAPVDPPSEWDPDANDMAYSGSPYTSRLSELPL